MNKKIIFASLALAICIETSAQVEQGRILVSGSAGLSASNYKEIEDGATDFSSSSTRLWLSPKAGYFITDQIVVGLGLNVSSVSTKYDDDDKVVSSTISFAPFARYYLPRDFFGQLEIGTGSLTQTYKEPEESDDKFQYSSFSWSLGVGYSHPLNDFIAIEPLLTYTRSVFKEKGGIDYEDREGELTLQVGLSIFLDML